MRVCRTWIRAVAVSTFGVVIAAACQGERPAPINPPSEHAATRDSSPSEGTLTMHQLKLTIATTRAEVLPDESFDIDVSIANRDSAPVDVPSPDATPVFEFVLRTPDDGRAVHVWDAGQAFEAHTGDPMAPEEPETERLAPGKAMEYQFDLAKFYETSVSPGSYALSFIYRSGADFWESPGVPLTFVRPAIADIAAVHGPAEENLSIVFTNTEADGSVALCQRESYYHRPDCGILCRQLSFTPAQSVTEVATAIELYYNRGIRWFAWLEGDALGAGVSQYRKLFGQIPPLPLGLESASLHNVGWQHLDERATFLAMGIAPDGNVAVSTVTLPLEDGDQVKQIPLSLSRMPIAWAAQGTVQGEEKMAFDIAFADTISGTTRLLRQTVDPESGVAQPPVTLCERKAPLVCLTLDPVAGETATGVDALFGPVGKEAQLTFLRLPIAGGAVTSEWVFSAPVDPDGQHVASDWAIPARPLSMPVVAVKLGDRLLVRNMDKNAEWHSLAEGVAQASHLRLEVIGKTAIWAVWADPDLGIQYRMIRE